MTEAKIAKLDDRGMVRVAGADALKLLQGLVTNDLDGLMSDPAAMAFATHAAHAGLLSPQGKLLFDFFCVCTPDGFVLDVARDKAAELVKRLTMYKLRAAVDIKDVSDRYQCFALWGPKACSWGPAAGTRAFNDPRLAELGTRILADSQFAVGTASATNLEVSAAAYHAHRIGLGVPEGGKDYDFGDVYPHEADFDLFNGVSFTKGCYVGQEIVARMQHKTVVRKRVVKVASIGNKRLHDGRPDILADGAVIGRLGSTSGDLGLALLRLDRVAEAEDREIHLSAAGVPLEVDDAVMRGYRALAGSDKKSPGTAS